MRPKSPGDLTTLDTDYTVVSTTNSLNFSESGWWGRIFSEMKVLIPILIGLVVGCGKKESAKPETKAKSPSVTPAQEANNNQPKTDPKPKQETKNSEPPVTATTKLITDPIIEKAIREALSTPFSRFTGELTKADLEKVTSLDLYRKQLSEVPKGLEKLTQLKGLELSENQLTDVKGLEKLTQLKGLKLHINQLTDVKGLEKLTQLKHLFIGGNKLADLKFLKKLTRLERLGLSNNQLINVKGLENLTQLEELFLERNKLVNLSGLEKLTKLKFLYLTNNPDLTKAQIAELQKALPKCSILHDFE